MAIDITTAREIVADLKKAGGWDLSGYEEVFAEWSDADISALKAVPEIIATAAASANMFIEPDGSVYRSTSMSGYEDLAQKSYVFSDKAAMEATIFQSTMAIVVADTIPENNGVYWKDKSGCWTHVIQQRP